MVLDTMITGDIIITASGSFIECVNPLSLPRAASSIRRKRYLQKRHQRITSSFTSKFSNARLIGHMPCNRSKSWLREVPLVEVRKIGIPIGLSILQKSVFKKLVWLPNTFLRSQKDLLMHTSKSKLKHTLLICKLSIKWRAKISKERWTTY